MRLISMRVLGPLVLRTLTRLSCSAHNTRPTFLLPIPSVCVRSMTTASNMAPQWGPDVLVRDREGLEAKLQKLKEGGAAALQVITDFDQTVTRAQVDGVTTPNTHDLIRRSGFLGEEAEREIVEMVAFYGPKYSDPNMDFSEKCRLMVEWWDRTHEVFIRCGINKNQFPEMVRRVATPLRSGFVSFFESLHHHSVPVLIFSAGLGDVIEEILRQQQISIYGNVHVISNYMRFDDGGRLVGFVGPLIHSFNKKETAIEGTAYAKEIHERKNVILLGDSLGDLQMADGIPHDVVLNVGFYNDKDQTHLDRHLAAFDLVVVGDGPADVANSLLASILQ